MKSEASDCCEQRKPHSELMLTGIVCSQNFYIYFANIKFPDVSFYNNNHTYTGETYLNLDLSYSITSLECPHELRYNGRWSQKLRGQFHQNKWSRLD